MLRAQALVPTTSQSALGAWLKMLRVRQTLPSLLRRPRTRQGLWWGWHSRTEIAGPHLSRGQKAGHALTRHMFFFSTITEP